MRTLGLDLSVVNSKTWLATVDWTGGRAVLVSLEPGLTNANVVERVRRSDVEVLGIDCPFGWPVKFVDLVSAHRNFGVDPRISDTTRWRDDHAWRRTDAAVKRRGDLKVNPLSVSADKIGHTAMRCATLLAELAREGALVQRDGIGGSVVEVYPAASLNAWDLPYDAYKESKGRPAREELIGQLLGRTPFLTVSSSCCTTMKDHDDALDAVIAALSARAARCPGLALEPTDPDDRAAARTEGWIWVPVAGSLEKLAN